MDGLIVLNFQNDYFDKIDDATAVIPTFNQIRDRFKTIIFVKDWFPSDHKLFEGKGGYAIADSPGAEIHDAIIVRDDDFILHKNRLTLFSSDSAFYNGKTIDQETKLNAIIKNNSITKLYFVGLMAEQFIFSTVLDAIKFKHREIYVIRDLSLGLNEKKVNECYAYLEKLGVKIINSQDLLEDASPPT